MTSAPREHDPRITVIQRELFDEKRSKLERYADLVVGRPGLWALFKFEAIVTLTSWVPGALGLLLRSKLYPVLLGRCGRNVTFGANVVLRHPHKIVIGDNVVIDDNCCLDAKGSDNQGITIGNGVFVGRNTILSCKNGDIVLDDQANIGFNVEIFAASRVRVGKKVLIAAYCYLVGGDHLYDRIDTPVLEQGRTAQRHRGRRPRVAGGARGRHRRLACREGLHHRRGRHRDRPDPRLRHRCGGAGKGAAQSPRRRVGGGVGTRGGRRGAGALRCAASPDSCSTTESAREDLAAMIRALVHRGPDEDGSIVLPDVALGMRRLAIMDVSNGQQPFANEDQSIQVVANGEIYNYAEVRSDLQARGHVFHTNCDIEVVAARVRGVRRGLRAPAARDVRHRPVGRAHEDADRRA